MAVLHAYFSQINISFVLIDVHKFMFRMMRKQIEGHIRPLSMTKSQHLTYLDPPLPRLSDRGNQCQALVLNH